MRIALPSGIFSCVSVLSLFLAGCGPDFDPPSEIHSLRVLAVQKDHPYAQPGSDVNMQMLWQDASPLAGEDRPIQIAWSPGCYDPPGDLYYACFADKSLFGDMAPSSTERATVHIPDDIISRRGPVTDGSKNPPYGITYVFFALCAGQLSLLTNPGEGAFPVGCKDSSGNLLGPDDFVAGYTSIYSFQGISNNNPKISGFEFRGSPVPEGAFCIGDDCQARAGSAPASDVDINCDDPTMSALCVPPCGDDGDPSCTGYGFRPTIDKTATENQDKDQVSVMLLGRDVGEQMWINYYTDAGGFKSPVRLLNDATNGWNDDYGTDFYAPSKTDPLRIWAVAHDNRGGMSWSGITLKVQ